MTDVLTVDVIAGGFAGLLVLPYRTAGCFLWIDDYGQTMLHANPVRHFHHPLPLCFGVVILSAILVADGVKAKVVVEMVFVQMSSDDDLKTIAPQFLCGLHPDCVA